MEETVGGRRVKRNRRVTEAEERSRKGKERVWIVCGVCACSLLFVGRGYGSVRRCEESPLVLHINGLHQLQKRLL